MRKFWWGLLVLGTLAGIVAGHTHDPSMDEGFFAHHYRVYDDAYSDARTNYKLYKLYGIRW